MSKKLMNGLKKFSAFCVIFCMIFFAVGCGSTSSNNESEAQKESLVESESIDSVSNSVSEEVISDEGTRTVTDMAGNDVVLPNHVERVACWSATCETAIVAMGQADKMLYSSTFASGDFEFTYKLFPELRNVEKLSEKLSNEELIARNVDVVFVKSKSNIEKLQNAGIPVFYLEFNNIEQTKESIRLIGEIFEVPDIADAYVKYIDKYIPLIQERLANINEEDQITVYAPLLRGNEDTVFNTYDPSHISTELFELCGAHVITQDITFTDNNGIITEEALIRINPDVIFLCGFYREKAYDFLMSGNYENILNAVDNKKIIYYPLGMYDWSAGGFELGISSIWVAKSLYPEYFEDINIQELTKEYYLDTTGVELSDEDIEYIFHTN